MFDRNQMGHFANHAANNRSIFMRHSVANAAKSKGPHSAALPLGCPNKTSRLGNLEFHD